jgi:enterochelin esterase-like enzyme
MKRKQYLMVLMMAAMLVGSTTVSAAEHDGPPDGQQQEQQHDDQQEHQGEGQQQDDQQEHQGEDRQHEDGQQGNDQHDGEDGSSHSGPPVSDETVDLEAVQTFTYYDLTITLDDAEGKSFTLTKSGEDGEIHASGSIDTPTNGSMLGMKMITQLTVENADDKALLAQWMPVIWSDEQTIVLKQDGTFAPDQELSKAVVDYTFENEPNSESVTGYSTTISVEDPEGAYESVWAYGMWMASAVDDTEANTCEPEDWENGMYYSDYGYRPMEYSDGVWSLTLDLASADMKVECFHDVDESAFSDEISVPDDSTIPIPYDSEKQSESFDWSITADNENAGTVTSVTIGDGIELAIYTPYGYDAEDAETTYPVLYLIPGMQTEYNTWFTGGKADKIFDNLIAEGKVAPTILVTMTRDTAKMDYNDVWDSADERSKSNGDGDGYINYEDGSESGSGTENMIQSLVVTDVIPYIDENYHTQADAAHRAIIGTSMGGVATTQIWMTSNELFDYYGFFSGADMWFKTDDDAKAADEYKALKSVYEADYTSLLDAAAAAEGKKILVGGGITDRNAFGGDQNSAGADNVSDWMTEHNVDHEYAIVGGGHDWTTWTQLLVKFTEFIAADGLGW